jgi:hypothetical protein
MKKACVMGHPVAHSRSPMIHGYWLRSLGIEGAYELKDLTPEQFPGFVGELNKIYVLRRCHRQGLGRRRSENGRGEMAGRTR